MYPAALEACYAPTTMEEALDRLAETGDAAMALAGGTGLIPAMNARRVRPRVLVDLNGIEALSGISKGPRGVSVRPTTRYRDLAATTGLYGALYALQDAAAGAGDAQIRNAATIGGGLCANETASCMPAVCLCLDATTTLAAAGGARRTLTVAEFLTGSGEAARRADELLIAIDFPPTPFRGVGGAYRKTSREPGGPPVLGVAALIALDEEGLCTDARLAVGGVEPAAWLFESAGGLLQGRRGGDALFAETAAAAAEAAPVQTDRAATAARRRTLIRDLGRDALAAACTRASDG